MGCGTLYIYRGRGRSGNLGGSESWDEVRGGRNGSWGGRRPQDDMAAMISPRGLLACIGHDLGHGQGQKQDGMLNNICV